MGARSARHRRAGHRSGSIVGKTPKRKVNSVSPYAQAALIAGPFTLAGAVVAVLITQRHAVRLAREARLEERRSLLRQELATLMHEVSALLDAAWILLPAMAKMSEPDLMEFVETDTGREAGRRNAQIRRSLNILTLMAADEPVLQALRTLETCIADWPDKAVGPGMAAARGGGNVGAAVGAGFRHVNKTRAA